MRDDTISRQAAIDALGKVDDYGDGIAFEVLSHAQMYISLLPSAERRGQWKQVGDDAYRCSACGEISCCNSPFCSECGAKMEGEEE